jgi:hypothetical protein
MRIIIFILSLLLGFSLFLKCEKNKNVISNTLITDTTTNEFYYDTVEVFLSGDRFMPKDLHPQDIDMISETDLYFVTTADQGFWRYNFALDTSIYLFTDYIVDYIALDSTYLFYNHGQWIKRYDLISDTIDQQFKIEEPPKDSTVWGPPNVTIWGLDVVDEFLFAIWGHYGGWYYIKKYTLDGTPVDSLPYSFRQTLFMTIHDNILYAVDYEKEVISRYNFDTKLFLEDKPWPKDSSIEGIRVFENLFLFADFKYRRILSVSLNEME